MLTGSAGAEYLADDMSPVAARLHCVEHLFFHAAAFNSASLQNTTTQSETAHSAPVLPPGKLPEAPEK